MGRRFRFEKDGACCLKTGFCKRSTNYCKMKQAEETAVAVATEGADLLTVGNEPELKAISDGIGELLRMGPVSEGAGEEAVVEGEVRVPLLEDRYLQIYEV